MSYVAGWAVLAIGSLGYLTAEGLSGGPAADDGSAQVVASNTSEGASNAANTLQPDPTAAERTPPAAQTDKLAQQLAARKRSLAEIVEQLAKTPDDSSGGSAPDETLASLNARHSGQNLNAETDTAAIEDSSVAATDTGKTDATTVAKVAAPAGGGPALKPTTSTSGLSVLNAPKSVRSIAVTRQTPTRLPPTETGSTTQTAAAPAVPGARMPPLTTGSIVKPPPLPGRLPEPIRRRLAAVAREKAARAEAERLARQRAAAERARAEAAAAKRVIPSFETAAVRRAPAQSPPAAPLSPATPPQMGVRLSKAETIDALRLQWTLLRAKYYRHLKGLNARYIRSASSPGTQHFVLVAGPVAGAMQALELCQDVSTSGTPCVVGDFVGNAL